jgi:uncharacterized protein (DUF2062 family)
MYFAYRVGNLILGRSNEFESINLSLAWLTSQIAVVWQPVLLGALVCGFSLGIVGFITVRIYWRWKISRYWRRRRSRMNLPP